jgi:hypothetical protein
MRPRDELLGIELVIRIGVLLQRNESEKGWAEVGDLRPTTVALPYGLAHRASDSGGPHNVRIGSDSVFT